ncbi:hypothetical protein CesoFtcFv8_023327 [Champsocephalus esox]|uniref:Uncharacterized protein n=2 Tax=Champsocephalus TaxID=52236 RepID=A0AAN8H8R9_CHAGU|nr:hypothetical protein CesoFtcFv8_023327 [Champsocephalus esox]KAK5903669.1 hypothetical protein CgunFtcFv8_007429 [Champsocephalus gunnari]
MEHQRRLEHQGALGVSQSDFHPCSGGREASSHRGLGWRRRSGKLSRCLTFLTLSRDFGRGCNVHNGGSCRERCR